MIQNAPIARRTSKSPVFTGLLPPLAAGVLAYFFFHFAFAWGRIDPIIQQYAMEHQGKNWTDDSTLYASIAAAHDGRKMWEDAVGRNGAAFQVIVDNTDKHFAVNHYTFYAHAYFGTGACQAPARKDMIRYGKTVLGPPRCMETYRIETAAAFPFNDWRIMSIKPIN